MNIYFKNSFSVLAIVSLLLFFGVSVNAQNYVITQNGGSFETQLSKIIKDIEKFPRNNSITVEIEKGYYNISKTININGGSHNVIIKGSSNARTIVSGSIVVQGWEVLDNGLWRTHVPKSIESGYMPDQLFVNGVRAKRSRTPNKGVFILEGSSQDSTFFKAKLNKADMELVMPFSSEEIPIMTLFRKWNVSKRYLMRISEDDNTLVFTGKNFYLANPMAKGNGVVIENTKGCIDEPGEWCTDKDGYIYYLPKSGEDLMNVEFRIPVVETLFSINNQDCGYTFKNIVFEHTTYQMPSEGIEYVQSAYGISAAIEVANSQNVTFTDCEIRNIANYGISLGQQCRVISIEKTYFHDLGAGAVKIGTVGKTTDKLLANHIYIENNIIQRYGQLMESAVGIILFNASDCKICHNDIHYGTYSGISLGWTWGFGESPTKRNEVSYNKISHIGDGRLNDLGGIYTLGKSEGTHIHYNVISDVTSGDYRGWGIYADEGTKGVLIEKNIAYRCKSGGFHQHYGDENVVSNNIFAWGELNQITLTTLKADKTFTLEHNIILMDSGKLISGDNINSNYWTVGSNCYWCLSLDKPKIGTINLYEWMNNKDSTSIYQDPMFRDPRNGDFRFKKKDVCKAIGFKPFDYSKAGVYGKRKWRLLARKVREK